MTDVLSSPAKAGTQIGTETGPRPAPGNRRTDWTRAEIGELFDLPLLDLLYQAQQVHRRHHAPNEVQLSTLLSIKTGGCPEDCGYCSQSVYADTGLKAEKLMDVDAVLTAAAEAKAAGSGRSRGASGGLGSWVRGAHARMCCWCLMLCEAR